MRWRRNNHGQRDYVLVRLDIVVDVLAKRNIKISAEDLPRAHVKRIRLSSNCVRQRQRLNHTDDGEQTNLLLLSTCVHKNFTPTSRRPGWCPNLYRAYLPTPRRGIRRGIGSEGPHGWPLRSGSGWVVVLVTYLPGTK